MPDDMDRTNDPIISDLVAEDPSYADIVEDFVNGLSQRLEGLQQALDQADLETLRRLSHQLKGSGGGYGYPVLSLTAARIEQEAAGQDLDSCRASVDELRQLIDRVAVGP